MDLGCQHSRGLVVKHVVATNDANNGCDEGRYQPCCPGAAGKPTVTVTQFESQQFIQNKKDLSLMSSELELFKVETTAMKTVTINRKLTTHLVSF